MYRNGDPKRGTKIFRTGLVIVAVIFTLIMVASRGCNPEDVPQPTVELGEQAEALEQQERIKESLPLPKKQDEPQGELEMTKLNPGSQVKEGW